MTVEIKPLPEGEELQLSALGEEIREIDWHACSTIGSSRRCDCHCPFCGEYVLGYVWSLAGSGKRCPGCRALLCLRVGFRKVDPK